MMEKINKYGTLLGIMSVILIYSTILGMSSDLIILEMFFAIPLMILLYKDINSISSKILIIASASIISLLMNGYLKGILLLALFLVPAIITVFLLKKGQLLSYTVLLVTAVSFSIFIIYMVVYNSINNIDFVQRLFILPMDDLKIIMESSLKGEKYVNAISTLNMQIESIRYLYISVIFLFILLNVFVQTILLKLIMSLFGWSNFKLKNILQYSPPRSVLVFTIIVVFFRMCSSNKIFIVAYDNLIVILMTFFIGIGIVFEIYLMTKAKSKFTTIVLIMLMIIALLKFCEYFICIGILDILFRFRKKTIVNP